ncbi:hypothetical protein Desaci_3296 [Desulfosporosinus acidiphilus SJ4]|uniref:Uncharacterized protein n=1 Tax=Desulfosporosinus acidiphilus (strain DSM 22704 / JCM 16185 / SJ4) TaxID=646529 RepID=I4D8R8_DESAJ|nr:hypothetical protein [Desulfosporosinus acidiphilus]AFM42192.1 hypothetical protein Desaci_3296 [Desulfosporosinus acidiphilus SJ4]
MNPGNTRMYGPVMRAPLLFHQNNAVLNSNYYPIQQSFPSYYPDSSAQNFFPLEQFSFPPTTSSPSYYQSYPAPAFGSMPLLPLGYAPVIVPDNGRARPVSANGLTLILIAILILVALDLTLVRPQKGY